MVQLHLGDQPRVTVKSREVNIMSHCLYQRRRNAAAQKEFFSGVRTLALHLTTLLLSILSHTHKHEKCEM